MFSLRVDRDLELALIEHRHAEALFDLMDENRDPLEQWLGGTESIRTVDDIKAPISDGLQRFAEGTGLMAGVWHQGHLAGLVMLNSIDQLHRRTNLTYWLGSRFWGKGIMTQACRAIIDYAFGELKLNRAAILVDPRNQKSERVAQRLGLEREGLLRQYLFVNGDFADMISYSILADEWQRS